MQNLISGPTLTTLACFGLALDACVCNSVYAALTSLPLHQLSNHPYPLAPCHPRPPPSLWAPLPPTQSTGIIDGYGEEDDYVDSHAYSQTRRDRPKKTYSCQLREEPFAQPTLQAHLLNISGKRVVVIFCGSGDGSDSWNWMCSRRSCPLGCSHIRDWGALSVELGRMNPRGRCAPAESGGNDLRQH